MKRAIVLWMPFLISCDDFNLRFIGPVESEILDRAFASTPCLLLSLLSLLLHLVDASLSKPKPTTV